MVPVLASCRNVSAANYLYAPFQRWSIIWSATSDVSGIW